MGASEQQWAELRRQVKRLARVVGNAEQPASGRNWKASQLAARRNLAAALKALVVIEDAEGVASPARWSDKLTALRQRAVACGLLTAADVSRAERKAVA